MKEFDKEIKGTLALEEIKFSRVMRKMVIKSNDRGGKISIPKELIGRQVYVILPDKE